MSALTSPLDALPDPAQPLPEAVIARRGGALRRLPAKAKVGGAILALFILLAIVGPWIAPFDPSATNSSQAIPVAPTLTHLLGTTATGQDVLSQLLVGTRSTVVLGLLTTKSPRLEYEGDVLARITEASRYRPLAGLALSTQCGFASGIRGNPVDPAMQERKLTLVADVARRVWG